MWKCVNDDNNRCLDSVAFLQPYISSTLVTFDLVVEGHCGIGDALPTETVENSTRHREAHDTEDGLHAKQLKQRYMSNCGTMNKCNSYLQNKDIIVKKN